jgi:endonuclease YncB( thermonuclease family)
MADPRAYSGSYRVKGARTEVALTGAWPWPLAKLLEVGDGDTVKLAIDHGFNEDAREWIRLKDVWAPEESDPGGPEATVDCQNWFREHAADGYVQVTTFRTSAPLEIRFRQSFTRYIGIVTALNGSELNSYLIDKGYVARGPASST